ncbi:MAG: ferritin-like domain-containing protein [Gemmatales bacterium]|nr:ferritin-like domain-containing protein [Gemmatales bacterium]MCS7160873.1 ferritin-like domain-containing protein [Gemmatales bacterium]MDW8176075.1 ferritin-like domain-containing protein [Gemmatales bacterium]MDW8221730.1 ferritin-like domain-containing protein [Gemmatales bacterium]
MSKPSKEVLEGLQKAYCMEVETVVNYLGNALHLEGVRADHIKQSLLSDIQGELGHAQRLGNRIKQLGGSIYGSLSLKFEQKMLQPPSDPTDVVAVIKGVIAAEEDAIAHYERLIELARQHNDYVTENLAVEILEEEETHRQQFQGYLKEYSK